MYQPTNILKESMLDLATFTESTCFVTYFLKFKKLSAKVEQNQAGEISVSRHDSLVIFGAERVNITATQAHAKAEIIITADFSGMECLEPQWAENDRYKQGIEFSKSCFINRYKENFENWAKVQRAEITGERCFF